MKKIFLALFLFTALQAFSQRNGEAVFDFTNPTGLNPSITPVASGDVGVNDKTFKSGPISISFGRLGDSPNPGARIATFNNYVTGETSYYLKLSLFTTITFKGDDGVVINKISISKESTLGGFNLPKDQPGELDDYNFEWTSNGADNVNSVGFNISGSSASELRVVTVSYTEPSDVLAPVSTDIYNGQTLQSFLELNLTFADNMSILNTGGITFTNADKSISRNMTASVDGRNVKLRLDSPVETDGTYTITIPARSFRNGSGYENKALTYTFNVSTPKNTLNYVSIDPELGNVDKLTNKITLSYPSWIYLNDEETKLILKNSGSELNDISVDVAIEYASDLTSKLVLTLVFPPGITEITREGVYTIDVPEKTITANNGGIWNPAFTLTYTIGSDPEPPTPVETETMKKANELLQMTGVGYPNSTSKASTALAALVSNKASDEELQPAIDAMYTETDVEMPGNGKYYKFAGVNIEGRKLYMSYTNGVLSFSEDEKNATALEAVAEDGKYTFRTADGKYLFVRGVTDDDKDLKSLSLSKMLMETVAAEKLFGCMAITGAIKNSMEEISIIPAIVDYGKKNLVPDATNNILRFDESFSSAFIITETDKPAEGETLELKPTVTPNEIVGSGTLTITFTGTETVTLADDTKPYITTKAGDRIGASGIYVASESANAFIVNVSGYPAGEYTLVLPEETFICMKDGVKHGVKTITADFKVTEKQVDYDFNYNYTTISYYNLPNNSKTPVKDTDLNNLIICWYGTLVADPNKTVHLVRYRDSYPIATGHFESVDIDRDDMTAIGLVLDRQISEGELPDDLYTFQFEKGTFGDANFGKFINGDRSISPSDCRANPFMTKTLNVNNKQATGISDVNISSTPSDAVIYDLTGRRVQSMSKAGVYIVNGRKVVVR